MTVTQHQDPQGVRYFKAEHRATNKRLMICEAYNRTEAVAGLYTMLAKYRTPK